MKRRGDNPDRIARIFRGCTEQLGAGRTGCRVIWSGPLEPDGRQPPVKMFYGRREDRLRAVYRLRYGGRLKRTDTVVQTCSNPLCVDGRHLRLVPAPSSEAAPTDDLVEASAPASD